MKIFRFVKMFRTPPELLLLYIMNQTYIKKLIEQGEGQQLDFKFAVNDSRKIARSLSAFSNTSGGTLLIGVKDNGSIAGIRTIEELYMLEAAASVYTKPVVHFESKEWNIGGKRVLEVNVLKSGDAPHRAPDEEGNWKTYLRVGDENIVAPQLAERYFRLKKENKNSFIRYGEDEKMVLACLNHSNESTFAGIRKATGIGRGRLENLLLSMMLMDIISMDFTCNPVRFRLIKVGNLL